MPFLKNSEALVSFLNDLNNEFTEIHNEQNLDDKFGNFLQTLSNTVMLHTCTKTVRENSEKWITNEIKNTITKKQKL